VLLDRIESEMGNAAPEVPWTMNVCLAGIGIRFPKHRNRAIAIGEKLGISRDYPVSRGCTSSFECLHRVTGRTAGGRPQSTSTDGLCSEELRTTAF